MAAAVAAVILVVTVAFTGSEFVMSQIEGVGSNLIYAHLRHYFPWVGYLVL